MRRLPSPTPSCSKARCPSSASASSHRNESWQHGGLRPRLSDDRLVDRRRSGRDDLFRVALFRQSRRSPARQARSDLAPHLTMEPVLETTLSADPVATLRRFPRVDLCHLPTPLEPMPSLTAHLGGARLFNKRDDATGLALGGNKARKLEFELGRLLQDRVDTIVTVGATQSNHARQTAAAAAKLGIACELVLEDRLTAMDAAYRHSGNVLIDKLMGASVHRVPAGGLEHGVEDRMTRLRSRGRRPALVVAGASTGRGALGYVRCAIEIARQAQCAGVRLTHVFHATGSGGTQAGLIAGFKLLAMPVRVWGICHGSPPSKRAVVERVI